MAIFRSGDDGVSDASRKLVSWKAIAEYFECDVRTAKRWENERKLPVYRAPGGKRGYVYAYAHELDEWLRSAVQENADAEGALENLSSLQDLSLASAAAESKSPDDWKQTSEPAAPGRAIRGWPALATACAVIICSIAGVFWIYASVRPARAISSLIASPSIPGRHVPVPEAEKLFLRGRYFWNLRTADSLSKAIDAYTQAIVQDPGYAEPYAGLAEAYELLPQFARADLGESFARAERAADRAIQLDPTLVAAHRAKAFALFFWDWDIAGSDAEFRRALELDPNSADTRHWYASTLFSRLEGPECVKQIDAALRLNPASAAIAADAALFKANFGDIGAGRRALKEIEETQPTLATPVQFLSSIDFGTGDFPAYVEDLRRFAAITGNRNDRALAEAVARGWARSGKAGLLEEQAKTLKDAFEHGAERGFVLGETLLMLGRAKIALPYFRSAIRDHHDIGLAILRQQPIVRSLGNDPEYRALFVEVDQRLQNGNLAHPAVLPVSFRLSD